MFNFVLAQLCGSLHFMQDSLNDSFFLSINVKKIISYVVPGAGCA